MELSRNEYPALVAYLEPNEASAVINDRLKAINKLNTDIADWLLERRKLEENYVLGLRKLSRRQPPDLDASLGVFEIPWRRVVSSTESLAQSHETLAQEIETDVERPLKEYASKNSEMQSMSSILQDLTGLVKELETAQKKAAKVKGKRGKGSETNSAVDDAKAQWQSRVPFVFEKLQAIDEGRISHLRDVLTQFQTHEADQVERSRQNAEQCLNALLNIDTAGEIKSFAEKVSGGRPLKTENLEQRPPSSGTNDLPPPPKIQNDEENERSTTSHGRPSMASSDRQREQQKSSGFGGLKRLGTVMSRRKSVAPGAAPSPERKFRSPFGFRKNDQSRNFKQMDEGGTENGVGRVGSRESLSSQRQDSRHGARNQSISDNAQPAGTNGSTIPEVTPEEEATSPIKPSTTGGSKSRDVKDEPLTDSEGYTIRPDTVDELTQLQREATAGDESAANLTIRDKPIEEDQSKAKQAMSDMANTLRVQAQQTGLSRGTGTLRGRRDVRNTIFIPNPSSPDAGPAPQGLSPAVSPGAPPAPVPPVQEPKPISSTDGPQDEHPISDNASIQSSHTLHSLSGPISHPELQSPGLNISIVEKLSVLISDGTVTRSYVVGELAMAYNPGNGNKTPSETQLVRLDNFQVLERVAANPQFVLEAHSQTPSESERPSTSNSQDKRGVYDVSLAPITGPSPNVAFKYQVHLDSSNLSSYCPVIFTPVWNEQEFQAKVIIAYSLNPNFLASQPPTSITLRNLTLSVSLDLNPVDEATKEPREVARATSAAMYPNAGATFRRKASAVVWKIPELVVSANEDGKFLAQFNTSTSWPRKGKVDAKFDTTTSDNSLRLGVSGFLPVSDQATKGDDPFADESNAATAASRKEWKELPTDRKLSVARYVSS